MSKYIPTIGLEVHAELKTATKMFCDCPNDPEEKHPNVNVCPICLGHPGTLPTLNKKAIELIFKLGFALGAKINERFKFDRKNYFYPDLPKGYQISQHDQPMVIGGKIGGIRVNHVHLEEDAARLSHEPSPDLASGEQYSSSDAQRGSERLAGTLIDFNRGGVPLMELVSEPDIHGPEQAVAFARELQLLLRYLELSDADLEKGQMRFDANVSISKGDALGTKVEIKNLNSFKALEQSLQFEIKRQTELLEDGKEIVQETRGWNEAKQVTVGQRGKEHAHDYRYFPEPDLPPIDISKFRDSDIDLEAIRLSVPELPEAKKIRLEKQYGLTSGQAVLLAEERLMAEFFEDSVSELEAEEGQSASQDKIKLVLNYLVSDLRGLMAEYEVGFSNMNVLPENFADLINLVSENAVSSRVAKDVLRKMMATGLNPKEIVKQEGLEQVSGGSELEETVKKIISENPAAAADYKKGKTNALQFLVGKAMAALRGRGNPEVLRKLLEGKLK